MLTSDIFLQIYKQYYRLMFQVAYSILRNTEDTEDALQEAFIRIDKNISKISDPFCPKTRNFVVIIVKRVALDIMKKKRRSAIEELSAALSDGIAPSPEKVSEEKSVFEMVKAAIRDLPDKYRECLYLSLIDEYTPEEISDLLEIKKQSVYKRLNRGKKILQDRLAEMGVSYED